MKYLHTEVTDAGGGDFLFVENSLGNYLCLGQKYIEKTATWKSSCHLIKILLKIQKR